jgi:hypothetical protein
VICYLAHPHIVIPAKAGIQLRLSDACQLNPTFVG